MRRSWFESSEGLIDRRRLDDTRLARKLMRCRRVNGEARRRSLSL